MGQKLVDIFNFARDHGGVPAVMRITIKTRITLKNASIMPDSKELIGALSRAAKDVVGRSPIVEDGPERSAE